MDKRIDQYQVIRNYLAANEAKEEVSSVNNVAKYFEDILSTLNGIEDEKLAVLVTDKDRLKRLAGHSWFEKVVGLEYVGGWPQIGDLEEDWCQGSVVDVANQVTINRDSGKRHIKILYEMVPIIDEVLTSFPPILVQGGEIRRDDNLLFLPFDADDGSHRCIAAVLAGKKRVKAYVGMM
jgi:hypothetical protein